MEENGDVYRFTIGDETTCEAVVRAVASVKGVDPLDIEPIARVVDPDAIDRLFANTDEGTVAFTLAGLPVEIHANGDVEVVDTTSTSAVRK